MILITWIDAEGGAEPTGRLIRPDGVNYAEELRRCPEAYAVVWSHEHTARRRIDAEQHAHTLPHGQVMELPNTVKALDIARAAAMEQYKTSTPLTIDV